MNGIKRFFNILICCFAISCSNPLSDGNSQIVDKNYPYPTGISDVLNPVRAQTFNWSCSLVDVSLCEYRFIINQTATHAFDAEPYGTTTTASQLSGDGTYYLHIQVRHRDIADYVSTVLSYRFTLDNTPPVLSSFTLPANALYNLNMDMDFRFNYSESVIVTGNPRLVIRVGAWRSRIFFVTACA